MYCLYCGKKIESLTHYCPHCNANQYGDNDEYYPDKKALKNAKKLLETSNRKGKKEKQGGLTEEEILALGLYPEDEGYKMSLISRILGKR